MGSIQLKAGLRPFLHRFRMAMHRVLGIQHIVESYNSSTRSYYGLETNEIYQRIMDRVCLLESHVNWRMYGLPSRAGNIKLELAATVARQSEIKNLIADLSRSRPVDEELKLVVAILPQKFDDVVVVGSSTFFSADSRQENVFSTRRGRPVFLCSPEDPTSVDWIVHVPADHKIVNTDPLTYLLAVRDESIDAVWLSDCLQYTSPLKRLLTLKHAFRCIRRGGIIGGINHSTSPLALSEKSFDWAFLDCIGIPRTSLSESGISFSIRK